MPWQRAGTVALTSGSTTVTGTNANFAANARAGDSFIGPDGRNYEVSNIASATVLSILPAYLGPTATGAAYSIMPVLGYDKALSDAFNNLNIQFGGVLAVLGTTATQAGVRASLGLTNTDGLPEGPTNKYMSATGVRGTALAGIDVVTQGAVVAGDSILTALGKLQATKAAKGANSDITSITGLTTALAVAQGGTGGLNPADARTGLGLGSAAIAAILGTVSQSGGVPTGAIFESGSSSAGSWVKFASGLMITVQSLSLAPGWNAVPANRYAGPIVGNMPALFVAAPLLFVQVRDASVSGRAAWCPLAEATNGNTFSLFLASPAASTVTSVLSFNIFSVGRWF